MATDPCLTATDKPEFSPLKLHRPYADQLDLLKSRNLAVGDDAAALATLQGIGYYRLVGYGFPLRVPTPGSDVRRSDDSLDGASFELAEAVYEFDRKLRLLVLDAIERVAVAVRVDIAHLLGRRHRRAHEPTAQLDANFCQKRQGPRRLTRHQEWLEKYKEALRKSRKEDFVAHHEQKYGAALPIRVATEIWDFGLLSKFFAGMKCGDQNKIASRYGISGQHLASWLRTIDFVRNVAAHHSRLWNRNHPEPPKLPDTQPHQYLHHLARDEFARRRTYGTPCILETMLRVIRPESGWSGAVKAHWLPFPQSELVNIRAAGFPPGWESERILIR
ncbi:Abi family protein [Caballeronia sp. LZ033]|uniref:Abi family protein n=1 Tax=Caballeronia sp. LZ033 TaxID=3038566 RepID=UPI002859E26C|nr:Abi family protein [Caballeronia sp. LZ033]MDR5812685.1 Abi family protein [Caballeronia sp. LZ033]